MLSFIAALTMAEALGKMQQIEDTMTDCALGVKHECQQLTTDIYEQDLNDLVIFQRSFRPETDAERDEWEENLRNLHNAAEDADAAIRKHRK